MIKAVGAASEKGAELDDLIAIGEQVNSVTRTMGMALTSCTPPAKGSPLFELGDDEMEMGVGIHGEPGRRREKLADANAIVDELVEAIASDLPFSKGDHVALMINGLGGTPISELYLLYGRAHEQLVDARHQRRPQLRRRVLHVARHGRLLGHAGEARRRDRLAARGTGGGGRSHLLTRRVDRRTRLVDHRAMVDEVPSVQDLRWPILVVLDALGDDELLDLEERVAQHLELSDEARNAVDPDSDRRFFLKRIEQALEDLYQADAIEPDDDGLSLHITDVGRRFTETTGAGAARGHPVRPADGSAVLTNRGQALVGRLGVRAPERALTS